MNDQPANDTSPWQRFWDSGAWMPALLLVVLFAWLTYLKWSK